MREIYRMACMRLGIWAMGQKYAGVSDEVVARQATMHDLHHQVQELTRQRDHWKLRESINRVKAQ